MKCEPNSGRLEDKLWAVENFEKFVKKKIPVCWTSDIQESPIHVIKFTYNSEIYHCVCPSSGRDVPYPYCHYIWKNSRRPNNCIGMILRAACTSLPTNQIFFLLVCFLLFVSRTSGCDVMGSKANCSGKNYDQLPSDSIPGHVTDLDVSKNKIKIIDNSTCRSYNAIKKLNLSHNEIVSIHPSAFYYLTEMESLDLSHNRLSRVDDVILNNNVKMKSFSLSFNKELSTIPQIRSNKLETFRISNCAIKFIYIPTFLGVESVQELDLSHNLLTKIATHTFDPINSLKVLNVSNNNLTDANFIESDCSLSLHTLDISSNNISSASFRTLEILLSIKTVHFRNNSWICDESLGKYYDRFLEHERNLNLKCASPSGKKFRSWHEYYVTQDPPEISRKYTSTTDLPETTSEVGEEISRQCYQNWETWALVGINAFVTSLMLGSLVLLSKQLKKSNCSK